ncbi:MAG: PLxRFG domain-containing protein [Deltaproteobacteria bacterium]|nr:PLxRFG domain-containing protein [Deltaproteobacteria bacterium]
MEVICPNFGDKNTADKFNSILERLGGVSLSAESLKNIDAYKKNLTPEQLDAFHQAYAYWNNSQGNAAKVLDFIDAKTDVKKEIPTGVINYLKNNKASNDIIKKTVEAIDGLVNPDFRKVGEQYKKMFTDDMAKRKDIGNIEKYSELPRNKGKFWPEFQKAFDIMGNVRTESRQKMNYTLQATSEKFLKGLTDKASIRRVEQVLVEGDNTLSKRYKDLIKESKQARNAVDKDMILKAAEDLKTLSRYSDGELKAGIKMSDGKVIKLNDKEIEAYTSARDGLRKAHKIYFDLLSAMELARYKEQKWYKILEAAYAADFSNSDIQSISGSLKKAGSVADRKISIDVEPVFKKLSEGIKSLTPKEKADFNLSYEKLYNELSSQIDMLKKAVGEVTGESDDAILTKTTKDMLGAYMKTNPGMKEISDMRNQAGNIIGYFPRVREKGKIKLRVVEDIVKKDKEGNETTIQKEHWMKMYSNKSDYAKLINEVMADPRLSENGQLKTNLRFAEPEASFITPEFAYGGVSDVNTMKVFNDALEKLKMPGGEGSADQWEALKKPLVKAMADELAARGWGSHMIRRQSATVRGYKEEGLQQVLKDYFSGFSGMASKQVAAKDYLDFMSKMREGEDRPELYEDLAKYGKDQLRNDDARDRFASKAKTSAFLFFLGGVLRQPLINMTQNFTVGAPILDQYMRKNGLKGSASLLLSKAMADVFSDVASKGQGKAFTDIEKRLLQELHVDGTTRDQYTREVLGHLEGKFGKTWNQITHYLSVPMTETEMLNRKAASVAMFRIAYPEALKTGVSVENAYEMAKNTAKEFTLDAHFYYGKANYPRLMSGGETTDIALKAAYTFRTFTHNYVTWMVRQADWRARAMSLGYLSAFGGLAAVPFVKDIMDEIEKRTGFNIKKNVRNSLKGIGGEHLAELGMYGLPSVFGANISGSLSIGMPGIGQGTPADTVFGVWGGLTQKGKNAIQSIGAGDYSRAMEEVSPEVLRSAIAAYRMGTAPATTRTGKPLFDKEGKPLQLNTREAIIRGLGIQPTRYSDETSQARSVQVIEKYYLDKHQGIINEFRISKGKKDSNAMKDLMKKVVEYNKDIKDKDVVGLIKPMKLSQAINASRSTPSKKQIAEERYLSRSE